MERVQKYLFWAIALTETSHVFCCVLPTVFSVTSLLAGLGVVTTMPPVLESVHHLMHDYEIPMITLSGTVVALGWILYLFSRRIDCHDTGCVHGPCEPGKNRAHTILKIATVLFVVNTAVYLLFHRGMAG